MGGVSFRGVALEGSCKSSKGDQEPEEVGEREMVGEMDEGRSRAMCLGVRQSEKVDAGLEKDPYTCERLSCISGGYSQLSRPQKVLSVDFTNPEVRPLSLLLGLIFLHFLFLFLSFLSRFLYLLLV